VEASVARCLRTPPDVAKRQGLKSVFQTALRGLSHRSIVVVGNYCYGPITAEPYRAKARPLHPRRSYFAPISCPPNRGGLRDTRPQPDGQMVEAPGTAPGSDWFIATAIYRHSRQAGFRNIGADGGGIKCGARRPAVRAGREMSGPRVHSCLAPHAGREPALGRRPEGRQRSGRVRGLLRSKSSPALTCAQPSARSHGGCRGAMWRTRRKKVR
jgi:hypothetical protein